MGFLSPALLGGVALIAIPIALHLVMRRQPRMHTFPALRFVKARRESNRRRMQLMQLAQRLQRRSDRAGKADALEPGIDIGL